MHILSGEISISKQKCARNLLKEIRELACKLTSTLIDPNHKFGEVEEDATVDREMY